MRQLELRVHSSSTYKENILLVSGLILKIIGSSNYKPELCLASF
jgi:hypothetical protein